MRGVRDDIQKLTDGTAARLNTLENDHVTRKEFDDHEKRVRRLEYALAIAIGVIGVVEFVIKFIK